MPKNSDTSWLREINASKGTAAVRDIINLPDNGHLYAAHVIHDIWREAQAAGRIENTIIVTDVGQHQMWEAQYFKHESPRSLVTSGGLGTMGFALPAAIGAKFACPEKDVWVIAGDGGFQMTAAELSTIVQEKLAINIAVINNGFLGMVRQWQETFYEKNYSASPILSPDFVMLAAAHGIDAANVTKRAEVTPTATKARTSGKPFLINFAGRKGRRRLPHDHARRRPPRDGPPPRERSPPRNRGGSNRCRFCEFESDLRQRRCSICG